MLMSEEQFTFIPPMKASPSNVEFLQSLDNDPNYAVGEKFDGYREQLHFGRERNEMLSSAGNSHIAKCPQFQVVIPELAGTVIDCEGLSPTRMLEDNAACFKADPYNAIEWQKKHGLATLVTFDILRVNGQEMMNSSFQARRYELERAYDKLGAYTYGSVLKLEKLVYADKVAYYESIIARTASEGHEGVILKDMNASYRPGYRGAEWLKVKREETVYTKITGFLPGVGKFANLVGSITFKEGSASGMDDDTRIDMTYHQEKYIGHTVQLKCQEITRLGSLRHPRYIRMVD
jgi:ATP-dependent DNA ligase